MGNLVSKECIAFIKKFEGFSATVYNDMVGVPTLGYGMTGKEIKGLTKVTEVQASDMLTRLVNDNYATPIKKDLDSKKVLLNQNQFDALVSMAYNVGVGGVLSSTLYKNVVKGIRDKSTITSNFQAWSNAGGVRVKGLFRRRTEEANMFLKTCKVSTPKSGKVIASTLNVRNKPDGDVIGTLKIGSTVKIDKKVGEWYSIFFGNHGGYVSVKYIK